METIGKRIARYRKDKHMTQEELAGKMGVSAQAVSKWETDTSCPDITALPQLCKILGITADELLTGKSEEVRLVPPAERKPFDELVFRVRVNSVAGDKVRVNLPMTLIKLAMEIGVQILPNVDGETGQMFRNVDMKKIVEMVERGLIGKIVEMESADGDLIEIVVE
jgi:transcriptional regulator with XRE-family HTH domain